MAISLDKSIGNIIKLGEQTLQYAGYNANDAKIDSMAILAHVISKPKSYLLTWPEQILSNGQVAMYRALLEDRAKGKPVAYILGQKEFYSLIFKVNESTLIPRPETELLVDVILDKYKNYKQEELNILDLGTGSGAIAVTVAKLRPKWNVIAVDISEQALAVAKGNAMYNDVTNIRLIKSNWLQSVDKSLKFDCIVSNPPYIASDDEHLKVGDVRFEPNSALVSDKNGLADIEEILLQAQQFLKPNGLLIFEHGYDQLADIKTLLEKFDCYTKFDSIKDYAGHDRAVLLQYSQ